MGELVIVNAELEPIDPPEPVDLDAVVGDIIDAELVDEQPARTAVAESDDVIDAEVVERPPWVSPLDGGGHKLRGGVVTEPAAREVINASIDYALMPWWRRLVTRRPAGYSDHLADDWRTL